MTSSNTQGPSRGMQRLCIILLALGLVAMLGTALVKRLQNPSLTEQRAPAAMPANAGSAGSQSGKSSGMSGGMPGNMGGGDDQVGALMQQVGKNPQDINALMQLAEALMHQENWQAAETFAQRASVVDLNNPQPLFMLGVILHNLGRSAEAAQALEKVIALQDTARVRYSLGVLYLYFLDQKEKGLACMEAGLKDPKIEDEIRAAIDEELQKHKAGSAPAEKQ